MSRLLSLEATQPVPLSPGIAFGCASLGTDLDWQDSVRLVEAALSAGFRHFDTAPPYGGGRSERILGEVLFQCRREVTLVSKVGICHPRSEGVFHAVRRLSRPIKRLFPSIWSQAARGARASVSASAQFGVTQVAASVAESMRRLRTEYLDGLLLHEVSADALADELAELLDGYIRDRRICALGTGTGLRESLACQSRWPQRLHWVQCEHYGGVFTTGSWRSGTRLITHGALRGGLRLSRTPEFLDALNGSGNLELQRRLKDSREAGRLILAAALQKAGAGNVVIVSTLKRERLYDLRMAVDDEALAVHATSLNQLFSHIHLKND